MAAKEYKVTLPATGTSTKTVVKIWANSAEQAARRAEREHGTGHVVTQRRFCSNVTRKQATSTQSEPADY